MGLFSGLFERKEPTRQEVIRIVVNEMVESELKPNNYINSLLLAEGQSLDNSLAEWHAVSFSIMHYAFAVSLGTADKISPMISMFRVALAERLSLNCRNRFLAIVTAREKEYLHGLFETLNSRDAEQAMKLCGSMGARITGHFDEKSGITSTGGPGIAIITAFFGFVVDILN